MRRYTPLLLALALTLSAVAAASADYPGTNLARVKFEPFRVSGTSISATTGKVAIAGGGSATVTDWLPVGNAEQFSIGTTLTATQTVSVVYTIQVAAEVDDVGVTAATPNPAITITRTAGSSARIDPISLPVCSYVRVSIAADATYPTTTTQLVIGRW